MLLRVGGTQGDAIFYDMSTNPVTVPPPGFGLVLTQTIWNAVNVFAEQTGFNIVFGINAGAGPRGNVSFAAWNSSNALPLYV